MAEEPSNHFYFRRKHRRRRPKDLDHFKQQLEETSLLSRSFNSRKKFHQLFIFLSICFLGRLSVLICNHFTEISRFLFKGKLSPIPVLVLLQCHPTDSRFINITKEWTPILNGYQLNYLLIDEQKDQHPLQYPNSPLQKPTQLPDSWLVFHSRRWLELFLFNASPSTLLLTVQDCGVLAPKELRSWLIAASELPVPSNQGLVSYVPFGPLKAFYPILSQAQGLRQLEFLTSPNVVLLPTLAIAAATDHLPPLLSKHGFWKFAFENGWTLFQVPIALDLNLLPESPLEVISISESKERIYNKRRKKEKVPITIVSVIVPFYNINNTEWFKETLSSLKRQTFRNFDIIIVDDGSELHRCGSCTFLYKELSEWFFSENGQVDRSHETPIPISIIRRKKNGGLAVARNTGALNSKAIYIFFLDPDDRLDPLALEKFVLAGMQFIGKEVPHYPTQTYGFIYSGVHHFGDKEDVTYTDYSMSRLCQENFLTSSALISRAFYIHVGGMCSRDRIIYYEDWDFWLRMASFGIVGKLVREPLFLYRRHPHGQSTLIQAQLRKEQSLREARKNNPVVFGEISRKDMELVLGKKKNGLSINNEYPCYSPMDWNLDMDYRLYSFLHNSSESQMLTWKTTWETFYHFSNISMLKLSYKPRQETVIYIIPWAVSGGADLYDLHMLEALSEYFLPNSNRTFHICLLLARDLRYHPWLPKFKQYANEVFQLPELTDSEKIMEDYIDYFCRTRNSRLAINRGTVAGYNAIQHRDNKISSNSNINKHIHWVDILHLYRLEDRTDWEWRAGRVSGLISGRVVVSKDLREYMIHQVKYGDRVLGRMDSPLERPGLSSTDQHKLTVIYPAIDLRNTSVNDGQFLETVSFKSSAPHILYISRLEEQKDPELFISVAWKLIETLLNIGWEEKGRLLPKFSIFGSGSFYHSMVQQTKILDDESNKYGFTFSRLFKWLGTMEHSQMLSYIVSQSEKQLLLVTSKYEGVPISILECIGMGIPVVTVDCGGIREIVNDPASDNTIVPKHLIHRTFCDSTEFLNEQNPMEKSKEVQRTDEAEKQYLTSHFVSAIHTLLENYYDGDIPPFKERWLHSKVFREKYGIERFKKQAHQLLNKLWEI